MLRILTFITSLMLVAPGYGYAGVVGYSLTVTTAYAQGDPFANRIDSAFVEVSTGYFQVANTGDTVFSGSVGTIAVSSFAGDLSFASGPIVLVPGASVSVAIPNNSEDVGGFNGPFYDFRPGVEITLNGTVSNGLLSEPVGLLVADADIHSGVWRTDGFGLATDSFVLQGGDPWGQQNPDAFALSQAQGVYVFSQPVPEPSSAWLLGAGIMIGAVGRLFRIPAG